MTNEAFPLQWPESWPRAPRRKRPPYKASFDKARRDLEAEIRRLGGREVVVSTNVPLRRDGVPYAGAAERLDDPGVAVYWTMPGKEGGPSRPMSIACDQWDTVKGNLRACGLTIEALRMLQRTGASTIMDRAFQAFAALPEMTAGGVRTKRRAWREVLGFPPEAKPTLADVKQRFRELVRVVHPDRGGTDEEFGAVTRAEAQARAELGG